MTTDNAQIVAGAIAQLEDALKALRTLTCPVDASTEIDGKTTGSPQSSSDSGQAAPEAGQDGSQSSKSAECGSSETPSAQIVLAQVTSKPQTEAQGVLAAPTASASIPGASIQPTTTVQATTEPPEAAANPPDSGSLPETTISSPAAGEATPSIGQDQAAASSETMSAEVEDVSAAAPPQESSATTSGGPTPTAAASSSDSKDTLVETQPTDATPSLPKTVTFAGAPAATIHPETSTPAQDQASPMPKPAVEDIEKATPRANKAEDEPSTYVEPSPGQSGLQPLESAVTTDSAANDTIQPTQAKDTSEPVTATSTAEPSSMDVAPRVEADQNTSTETISQQPLGYISTPKEPLVVHATMDNSAQGGEPGSASPLPDTISKEETAESSETKSSSTERVAVSDAPSSSTEPNDSTAKQNAVQDTTTPNTSDSGPTLKDTSSQDVIVKSTLSSDTPTTAISESPVSERDLGQVTADQDTSSQPAVSTKETAAADSSTKNTPAEAVSTQISTAQDIPVKESSTEDTKVEDTPLKSEPGLTESASALAESDNVTTQSDVVPAGTYPAPADGEPTPIEIEPVPAATEGQATPAQSEPALSVSTPGGSIEDVEAKDILTGDEAAAAPDTAEKTPKADAHNPSIKIQATSEQATSSEARSSPATDAFGHPIQPDSTVAAPSDVDSAFLVPNSGIFDEYNAFKAMQAERMGISKTFSPPGTAPEVGSSTSDVRANDDTTAAPEATVTVSQFKAIDAAGPAAAAGGVDSAAPRSDKAGNATSSNSEFHMARAGGTTTEGQTADTSECAPSEAQTKATTFSKVDDGTAGTTGSMPGMNMTVDNDSGMGGGVADSGSTGGSMPGTNVAAAGSSSGSGSSGGMEGVSSDYLTFKALLSG